MDNKTEIIALTQKLQKETKSYSIDVIKSAIAQTTLEKAQINTILSSKGLKGELLETTTAQLAETTTLNALSASETAATGTTAGLSTAFQGLATSIGISTAALGTLIAGAAIVSAATVAYRQYKQHLEEVRQETAQAADVYKDSSSSVEEYASRYQSLHSALLAAKGDEEKTCQIKKQLLELQTELNDKFGDAYGRINLVTDAYKDQTDAIKAYNKEAARGGSISVDDTIFELAKDSDFPSVGTGSAKSAKTETNALSNLNSEMDKLQSSYKSLCDIRNTYNQNGKATVDQYPKLTNMGFTFLSQLVDENGQLGLNASAFERLSQAKLQEMQIQMARNATGKL